MNILETKHIDKYFHDPVEFQVLKNISFDVKKGEFLTMIGKSGSGKSTLLYILSTMDTDYKGELYIDNQLLTGQTKDQLAELRNEKSIVLKELDNSDIITGRQNGFFISRFRPVQSTEKGMKILRGLLNPKNHKIYKSKELVP